MTTTLRLLTVLLLAGLAAFGFQGARAQSSDTPSKAQATKAAPSKAKAKDGQAAKTEAASGKKAAGSAKGKGKAKTQAASQKDAKSKAQNIGKQKPATAGKETSSPAAKPAAANAIRPPAAGIASKAGMALAATASTPPAEIEATKQALAHARAGRAAQAAEIQRGIKDPVARKLIEWMILRSDAGASLARYIVFIDDNPNWLSIPLLRRRAEAMLWNDPLSPAAVRSFFARHPPLTAKGHFAQARALLALGDRAGAEAQLRAAWHSMAFSGDLEDRVLQTFNGMLTAADHKVRMDMRLYADDIEAAARSAKRVGGHAPAIVKARAAVIRKGGNPKAALDAVPAAARQDLVYLFSLAQMHRKAKRPAEAGAAILAASNSPAQVVDGDQWWIERRLAVRGMLDLGEPKKAYRIANEAATPKRDIYQSDQQFTAGWIALRFLKDPATAQKHFIRAAKASINPVHVSRAHYWHARALEAMGRTAEARAQYQAAAQHPTAYYGQIAHAHIGKHSMALRAPPPPPARPLEMVRAVELLYATGNRDLVPGIFADLGERLDDAAGLAALAEVAARNDDARAVLLIGKAALARDLPLEIYAFPTFGLPDYTAVGPAVEKSLIYAIARQESTFNPTIVSKARAMGLMQMTPGTGRIIAKKYNVGFVERKLLTDPAYNVQLGAAELGTLMADFRGSYILTFVGYNAGRGRVRDWTTKYGDPRDQRVDPVDWVERIPIAETRFYIQRVMENLQVYRARFNGGGKLTIEADLRRGATAN